MSIIAYRICDMRNGWCEMKEVFQSKDIQKVLEIPKQRVEYLALKVPIKPEIEEVDRSGMVHIYSFINVLQFAIAHTMNKYGLGISEVRGVLRALHIVKNQTLCATECRNGITQDDGSLLLTLLATKKGEKWQQELEEAIREYYEPESEARIWCGIAETERNEKRVKTLVFYVDKDEWYKSLEYSYFGYITTVIDLNKIKSDVIKNIENM